MLWDLVNLKDIKRVKDAHYEGITCATKLTENVLITGSDDKRIKLWSIPNLELIKTFKGHSGTVYGLEKINEFEFLSSSEDTTIKKWNIQQEFSIKTYIGHKSGIWRGISLIN